MSKGEKKKKNPIQADPLSDSLHEKDLGNANADTGSGRQGWLATGGRAQRSNLATRSPPDLSQPPGTEGPRLPFFPGNVVAWLAGLCSQGKHQRWAPSLRPASTKNISHPDFLAKVGYLSVRGSETAVGACSASLL